MRTRLRVDVLAALLAGAVFAGHPPDSPVADAAMRGDAEAVRSLLRRGADVNAAQGDGMTALHWAADLGDAAMARMLVRAGAAVSAVTRIGQYTPLHLASRAGSADVAGLLLAAGSDPSATTSSSGVTPLHLAALAGNARLITLLLEHGADPDAREAAWDQTPLIFAAAQNRAEAIAALLEGGADVAATTRVIVFADEAKRDAAARRRQNEVLKAFGHDGAEGGVPTPRQLQAAVLASREAYLSVDMARKEEDEREDEEENAFLPSIESMGGLTALLHAARQGHIEAATALLDHGADVDQVSGSDGSSPLLIATINAQYDMAAFLLGRGADPNLTASLNGVTPLWAAVNSQWQPRTRFPQPQQSGLQAASYLDVVRALLEAGANPDARITKHPWYMVYTGCGNRNCGLVDTNGSTAFWRAAYATDVESMKLLIEFGADPQIPTVAPPRRERLSTDEFLKRQHRQQLDEGVFKALSDSSKVKLLIDIRGELPDSAQSEFDDEAIENDPDSVREALRVAAEAADSLRALAPDPSGLPPVEAGGPAVLPIHAASGVGYGEGFAGNAHRHVPDGWMPAVRYLLEEVGADVNARDHNGYTALHHAAARGDNELILYLVEKGGDVTVVSRRGETTADMANGPVQRVSPFPETVALLESLGSKNNHNCVSC